MKKKLEEEYGLEVKPIREKWEGRKLARHHGDFYFRKPNSPYWLRCRVKGRQIKFRSHNYIYANEGLLQDKIFHEIVKLLITDDEVEQAADILISAVQTIQSVLRN